MDKKFKENYYDYWANQYILTGIGSKLKIYVENQYLNILLRVLNKISLDNIALLEIGPGKGFFAHVAIDAGADYYGIEFSKTLAVELKKQNMNIESKKFTSKGKYFKNKKFDVIYISHVLEHCDTRNDAVDLIKASYQRLKKDGIIMINAPNVLSHKFLFWIADYSHNFVTTPLRVRNLLIDQGFETLLIYKTVFGFMNWFLRKFFTFAFKITPGWLINLIGKKFMSGSEGGLEVFGCENFTIIGRKDNKNK